VSFLKTLVIVSFIALGAVYIAITAATQRELATDTITSIVLGALFIAGAYGIYRDAKWGYYLSLATSVAGIAIALMQGLPIAVALFAILAASTFILVKKELKAPTMRMATPPATPPTKSIFIYEKRFVKRKERVV